jgi:hypothetical protein
MPIPIIGLLGRSRHGKDTIASVIHTIIPSTIVRLAQPLKDAVVSLYGFTYEQVEGDAKEMLDSRYEITPRYAIQSLCDHIMNLHGRDFFSRHLFGKYDFGHYSQHGTVIIPDIRYEHDLQEVRSRGGIIIKVIRNGSNIPNHSWETAIDDLKGDITIENNGSLDELIQKTYKSLVPLIKPDMPRGFYDRV